MPVESAPDLVVELQLQLQLCRKKKLPSDVRRVGAAWGHIEMLDAGASSTQPNSGRSASGTSK